MDTIWQPNLADHPGPKYKALVAALRDSVVKGELSVGEKLPPVRDLAWRIGITPGTVARAYTILTDEGVLEAAVGRGTFVAPPSKPTVPEPLGSDAHPHGADQNSGYFNLMSPALPDVGQAALIRQLMGDVARNPPSGLMHYPNRRAFKPARDAVVRWLSDAPLGTLNEDDVVLSHGGQNGISLVLQTLLRGSNPVVLVEELAYPGFRRAADLLRATVVPVAMDDQGIVPSSLEHAARTHGAQVLCTSPEVHNPTVIYTPPERRRAIVDVARRHDLQIIEDDCYRMGTALSPSYRMIARERSWYVSSISKTLTPALRIGFAIAPEGQGASLRRSAEHGFFGLATPLADLTAILLAHPQINPLADAVVARVGEYVRSAVNILGRFELRWREDVPFLWLRLPGGWRASAFCQAAEASDIKIRPAEDFIGREARAPHAVRVAINAQMPRERFEEALHRLCALLDEPPERIGV